MSLYQPHHLQAIISHTPDENGHYRVLLFDKTIREEILRENVFDIRDSLISPAPFCSIYFNEKSSKMIVGDTVRRINSKESVGIKVLESKPGLAYLLVDPKNFESFYDANRQSTDNSNKNLFDKIADFCIY